MNGICLNKAKLSHEAVRLDRHEIKRHGYATPSGSADAMKSLWDLCVIRYGYATPSGSALLRSTFGVLRYTSDSVLWRCDPEGVTS